ncbi:MAG: ABC transporter ATP-binding protein, partial [Deltaproteobacteria bacterium]|nr:ABC transporter ATP-binding protein [Deltaproteobacteria bacterium]
MDKVVVTDLVKRFGEFKAVDRIGFSIRHNEFFSLLGPSGCGKSTTLRCIAGLEDPDGGSIEIGGRKVFDAGTNVPPNKRLLGMVFQNYAIWPHMTVDENISYPLRIAKKDQGEIRKTVARVMETLGIGALGRRKPHELSGGQQQRVALGRSLAMEPSVLLLDEPLSNLDAKLREEMRVELKTIQERTGTPILYVTHDQLEAMALSDRIAIMKDGKILQCAAPLTIYNQPVNRFVFDFIGQSSYLP